MYVAIGQGSLESLEVEEARKDCPLEPLEGGCPVDTLILDLGPTEL